MENIGNKLTVDYSECTDREYIKEIFRIVDSIRETQLNSPTVGKNTGMVVKQMTPLSSCTKCLDDEAFTELRNVNINLNPDLFIINNDLMQFKVDKKVDVEYVSTHTAEILEFISCFMPDMLDIIKQYYNKYR